MPKKFSIILAIAALLMLTGAGCGKSTTTTNTTNETSTVNTSDTSSNSVTIQGSSFSPATMTVTKGTTVTWTNNDPLEHTVTGDQGGPASGVLRKGDRYPFTFDTVGEFPYHCEKHGVGMAGTIIVTE